ncbi:MAG: hypothetical protein HZC48_01180 [Nitrospirae bacterium]|nr:hypothetical protein [Nitrospirota bacterium]
MQQPNKVDVSDRMNIPFSENVTLEHLDRRFSYYSSKGDNKQSLVLDFSKSEFIEPSCLIYLISLLINRTRNDRETILKLPRLKKVRDFLRSWSFPDTIKNTTGLSFWAIVTEEDRSYFGENPSLNEQTYAGKLFNHYGKWERILQNYLPILELCNTGDSFNVGRALTEANRWKREVISSVLEKHLYGPHGFFASRIVFEAIMNAVRHPNASIILTTSCLRIDKGQNKGQMAITWWDDGKSMIDTLREVLNNGNALTRGAINIIDKYRLVCEYIDGNKTEPVILTSDLIPDKTISDLHLLLAATFPGITCDLKGETHVPSPETAANPILSSPGMGLYLLINAACNVYHGSVSFRTKGYFMEIKPAKSDSYGYEVNARYYSSAQFLGNMLTVNLPLQKTDEI